MAASVLCHLCEPADLSAFGIPPSEPTHHYGQTMSETKEGLLGGWICRCECSQVHPESK